MDTISKLPLINSLDRLCLYQNRRAHERRVPASADRMAQLSGEDTALDVACGAGMVACAFATIASHVTGIDITPAMLEQSRLLAQRCGLTNLSWRQGNIETLPFPDNEFSVVVSRYAFHHLLNPDIVLAEMARVCRPGGRILIADGCPPPEKVDAYNHFEKLFDPSHHRALTLEEFLSLINGAGLQTRAWRITRWKWRWSDNWPRRFPILVTTMKLTAASPRGHWC